MFMEQNNWDRRWNDYLQQNKSKIMLLFPRVNKFLHDLTILDGRKTESINFFQNQKVTFYEVAIGYDAQIYTFFQKVLIEDGNQELTRWRYETEQSLELPLEQFLTHELDFSKREAKKIEQMFDNFSFIKYINEIERNIVK
jgi:hypothetical protein